MIPEPDSHDQTSGKLRGGPGAGGPGRPVLAEWQLRRIREAIVSTDTPWTLEAMAALVGMSPDRFCKRFRAATGCPPHRWLMLQRIERAKQLLGDGNLTLTDIAYACGYASSAHFSTSFGRATGTTPSEYRRLHVRA
ncbi:helix-turn-helix transcriptional regulator [Bradyrhizobium huanghuaihaiense]|uniref:helix-turn-helix transcriptional regulator n=1 Tax=Bradyrhizobium huanghuaihaiense TaxID=990078 RepID=UPI0021A9C52C|nr:helix-turn-helix transcriptional regulator [Bradyrhizobium sp. CB3035]UWU78756.1 helix-turn-helix transcriptional regulator [Bradyrhizobium sp. CB3035]